MTLTADDLAYSEKHAREWAYRGFHPDVIGAEDDFVAFVRREAEALDSLDFNLTPLYWIWREERYGPDGPDGP